MIRKRKVEIFNAGCPLCEEAIHLVNDMACLSCDIEILDMKDAMIANKAKEMGIHKIPTVVIEGKITDCCAGGELNQTSLKRAGIGQPL